MWRDRAHNERDQLSSQIQMDDANYRLDRIRHARDCELGEDFVSVSAEVYSPASLQTLRRRLDPPKHTGPFFAWYDFKKTAFSVYTSGGVLGFLGIYTGKLHLPTPAIVVQLM